MKILGTKLIGSFAVGVIAIGMTFGPMTANSQPMDPKKMQQLKKAMMANIKMLKPEMQKKIMALSPESKKKLMGIMAEHTRRSKNLTLRQIMNEVLADLQSIVSGIATANTEQVADSARRLANHRLPKGGILPYLKPEKITDDVIDLMVSFNDTVEGNAKRLAAAAEKGDLNEASNLLGDVVNGCVGCHDAFRGQPGVSAYIK